MTNAWHAHSTLHLPDPSVSHASDRNIVSWQAWAEREADKIRLFTSYCMTRFQRNAGGRPGVE